MRYLSAAFILMTVLVSQLLAQVDTLQLSELRAIQTPQRILNVFAEELTGDNFKDIVVCTQGYIYIYDGSSLELYWTSPEVSNPKEVKFSDINGDGRPEIIYYRSQYLYVFNLPNTIPFWVSPLLGVNYQFYGIGDRNADGYNDIVMVRQEPFQRPDIPNNMDTVWVEAFSGPSLSDSDNYIYMLPNYRVNDGQFVYQHTEKVYDIFIGTLPGPGYQTVVDLFSSSDNLNYAIHNPSNIFESKTGRIRILRGYDLTGMFFLENMGYNRLLQKLTNSGESYLYGIADQSSGTSHTICFNRFACNNRISGDTMIQYNSYNQLFRGFLFAHANIQPLGYGMCYGIIPSLIMLEPSSGVQVWNNADLTLSDTIISTITITNYNDPQVVMYNKYNHRYSLVDCITGYTQAIFTVPTYPAIIFENNGVLQVLTFNENMLHINGLFIGPVQEQPALAVDFRLSQNYPNPFNAQTLIKYDLPKTANVTIDIYDLLGRKVETFDKGTQAAGQHQVIWDGGKYSSGMYFYKLTAGEESFVRKAVLIK
jgi:hypothetical protein